MCRYAFKTYKVHFVCFACRKQFKRPPLEDFCRSQGLLSALHELWRVHHDRAERKRVEAKRGTTLDALRAEHLRLVGTCPQCAGPMANMGLDFKPPPASATRAWSRLATTLRLDHRWHTCGDDGPGWIPTDATDFGAYLAMCAARFAEGLRTVRRPDGASASTRPGAGARYAELLAIARHEQARRGRRAARASVAIAID